MRKNIILFIMPLLLWGCSDTFFLKKNANQESVEDESLVETFDNKEVGVLWGYVVEGENVNGHAFLRPAVVGDFVYTVGSNGDLTKLALKGGSKVWEVKQSKKAKAGVSANTQYVISAYEGGVLRLHNAIDGSLVWEHVDTHSISAIPIIAGGSVIARTSNGAVLALSLVSGEVLWKIIQEPFDITYYGDATPLPIENALIIGTSSGKLLAVDIANGALFWESTIAIPHGTSETDKLVDVDATPLFFDNTFYVGSMGNRTVAVALHGDILWSAPFSSAYTPVADDENIYIVDPIGSVVALERETGDVKWMQNPWQEGGLSSPVLINDVVYVGSVTGELYALNKDDGELLYEVKASKGAISHIQSLENKLLMLTSLGELSVHNLEH